MDDVSLNVHVWPNSDCFQCKIGTLLMHFIYMYVYIFVWNWPFAEALKFSKCFFNMLTLVVNTLVHTTTPESTENVMRLR